MNLFHFFHKGSSKPHYSILYRMHYLTCGIKSPTYHTCALK